MKQHIKDRKPAASHEGQPVIGVRQVACSRVVVLMAGKQSDVPGTDVLSPLKAKRQAAAESNGSSELDADIVHSATASLASSGVVGLTISLHTGCLITNWPVAMETRCAALSSAISSAMCLCH